MLEAVKLDGWNISEASTELMNDAEVVLEALKTSPDAFWEIGRGIREMIGDNDPVEFLVAMINYPKLDSSLPEGKSRKIIDMWYCYLAKFCYLV